MRRTYKFRLYPTQAQQDAIQFTIERCRLLYNRLLQERILAYKEYQKSLSYYEQKKTLPVRKRAIPSLKQVHSQVLQHVVERLDTSYQAFFRRVKQGDAPGFPRYKSETRYHSFTYPQSGFRIEKKDLILSKIGAVRMLQHRQMEGIVKTCTIVHKNGKYYDIHLMFVQWYFALY